MHTTLFSVAALAFFVSPDGSKVASVRCQLRRCGILSRILPQSFTNPPLSSKKCIFEVILSPNNKRDCLLSFLHHAMPTERSRHCQSCFFASPWQLGDGGFLSSCQLDFEASCQDSCQPDLQIFRLSNLSSSLKIIVEATF